VIAVDTSVVVAAFASWHQGHRTATEAMSRQPRIPSHVLLETYSVLTRLPPPHRAPPDVVVAFLQSRFSEAPLVLSPAAHLRLIERAAVADIVGGGLYDAVVAATAAQARALLLTRDRRAAATYQRMNVGYELLE
jgi:predicted nucleic acid-binding protein